MQWKIDGRMLIHESGLQLKVNAVGEVTDIVTMPRAIERKELPEYIGEAEEVYRSVARWANQNS